MDFGFTRPRTKNIDDQLLSPSGIIHKQQQHPVGCQKQLQRQHDVPLLSPPSEKSSNKVPWYDSGILQRSRQRLSPDLESSHSPEPLFESTRTDSLTAFGGAVDEQKSRWTLCKSSPKDMLNALAGSTLDRSRTASTGGAILNSSSKLMRRLMRSRNDGSPFPAFRASTDSSHLHVPHAAAAKPVLLRRSFEPQPRPPAKAKVQGKLLRAAPEDLAKSLLQITSAASDDRALLSNSVSGLKVCTPEVLTRRQSSGACTQQPFK